MMNELPTILYIFVLTNSKQKLYIFNELLIYAWLTEMSPLGHFLLSKEIKWNIFAFSSIISILFEPF